MSLSSKKTDMGRERERRHLALNCLDLEAIHFMSRTSHLALTARGVGGGDCDPHSGLRACVYHTFKLESPSPTEAFGGTV